MLKPSLIGMIYLLFLPNDNLNAVNKKIAMLSIIVLDLQNIFGLTLHSMTTAGIWMIIG